MSSRGHDRRLRKAMLRPARSADSLTTARHFLFLHRSEAESLERLVDQGLLSHHDAKVLNRLTRKASINRAVYRAAYNRAEMMRTGIWFAFPLVVLGAFSAGGQHVGVARLGVAVAIAEAVTWLLWRSSALGALRHIAAWWWTPRGFSKAGVSAAVVLAATVGWSAATRVVDDTDSPTLGLVVTLVGLTLLAIIDDTVDAIVSTLAHRALSRRRCLPSRGELAAVRLVELLSNLVMAQNAWRRDRSILLNILGARADDFDTRFFHESTSDHVYDRAGNRRSTLQLGARIATALREQRESLADAMTDAHYDTVVQRSRDLLVSALRADWSALPPAMGTRRRRLVTVVRHVAPALLFGAAALVLPALPGLRADADTLVRLQVGLGISAALWLVGAPPSIQKMIGDAVAKADGGK